MQNYKTRITRLEQLKAQIYQKTKELYPLEDKVTRENYEKVIRDTYNRTMYDTAIGTGYDIQFNSLDDRTVRQLLNNRWSKKKYSERIWNNTDILGNQLGEILGASIISGQGLTKTIRQVTDVFNAGKYNAERLIRTETNYFHNQADALAYEELGIDKYVCVATLDGRTSKFCQGLNNQVFNYKDIKVGKNFPPFHPNCRCKTRGYVEEYEHLLKRRAKDLETGEESIIDNMSYNEWQGNHNIREMLKNIKKSGIINNKGYKCELAKKLGKKHYDNIHKAIKNCKNKKAVKLWKKYEAEIKVADSNYGRTAMCRGNSIYVNIEMNSLSSEIRKPYQVVFHECGHAIDNLASYHNIVKSSKIKLPHFSSKYKDGLFPQTIIDEVTELVNKVETKLKKEFEKHANDLKWFVNNDFVRQWSINEHGEIVDLIPKNSRTVAYEYLKREILKNDGLVMSNLADILDGATNGRIYIGIGHGEKYWRDRTFAGISSGLATEAFAEMTDATFTNIEALNLIKEYLPKSYDLYLEMIDVISS